MIATDGYTNGLAPELDAAIRPVRDPSDRHRALGERLYDQPFYGRTGYDYWQKLFDPD